MTEQLITFDPIRAPTFQVAAKGLLADTQLRKNVRHATTVIQNKRKQVVNELPDWQELRESARQIKDHTLRHLAHYLEQFEANCTRAGGVVHWARDAAEARDLAIQLVRASGSSAA